MSTASRLTLLGTIVGTAGIVGFVHWAQTAEKAVIYHSEKTHESRLIS
jgi:PET assembly of cytochrome c oxidase, mitochondrial